MFIFMPKWAFPLGILLNLKHYFNETNFLKEKQHLKGVRGPHAAPRSEIKTSRKAREIFAFFSKRSAIW